MIVTTTASPIFQSKQNKVLKIPRKLLHYVLPPWLMLEKYKKMEDVNILCGKRESGLNKRQTVMSFIDFPQLVYIVRKLKKHNTVYITG